MNILKSKSTRYATSAVLVSSLFSACGGGGGGGSGGSSPAAPPPVAATPAVTLSSVTPAANTTKVSTTSAITMTFSGPLDPATLTAANVRLTGGGITTPVSVSWDDATRTLTIRPQQSLNAGVQYTVAIPGVRDNGGNAIANSTIAFKTFISLNPRTFNFTNGVISSYSAGVLDNADNIILLTTYNGKGVDNLWDTADDDALSYQTIAYDANGNPSRFVNYSAGADKKANTSDDTLTSFTAKTYDNIGNITQVIEYDASKGGLGVDGKPFTADDLPTTFTSYTYNAGGYVTKIVNFSGPGPDGKAFTSDDLIASTNVRTYDSGNALLTEVTTNSAGTPTRFSRRTYDRPGGSELTHDVFSGPGPDNLAFTADDVVDYLARTSYDSKGLPTRVVFYDNPGPDTQWNTTDDRIGGHICFTYGPFGLTLLDAYNGNFGVDSLPCTADDASRQSHYSQLNYDASGNLLLRTTYNGPGVDGTWKTSDDQVGEAGNFFGF